jgi:hypothetical protein
MGKSKLSRTEKSASILEHTLGAFGFFSNNDSSQTMTCPALKEEIFVHLRWKYNIIANAVAVAMIGSLGEILIQASAPSYNMSWMVLTKIKRKQYEPHDLRKQSRNCQSAGIHTLFLYWHQVRVDAYWSRRM